MCYTPITINKDTADAMTVGCGRCMACHLKYCNQWQFRLKQHARFNPIFYCVTLTYDNEHLPTCEGVTKEGEKKQYMTLRRKHAQLYFKTLRNLHALRYPTLRPKISYLICGEYGDRFKRPHYHAIIFGAHPSDILTAWRDSNAIPRGMVYFGESNLEATTNYTLKYAMKSRLYKLQNDQGAIPYEKPFINVSKGLGEDYIVNRQTGEMEKQIPDIISMGKIKVSLPRYYANKINRKVDTEKYRLLSIEKDREMRQHLTDQGITFEQWRKMYHKWLWKHNKIHTYDNEIFTDHIKSIINFIQQDEKKKLRKITVYREYTPDGFPIMWLNYKLYIPYLYWPVE